MLTWEQEFITEKVRPIELHSITDNRVDFFIMNDLCYIMDGVNYYVFDGNEVRTVDPYIPTISVSKEPTGGGTAYEDFNLLGAGFIDSFSTLGTDTMFTLSFKGLDVTPVVAVVNGTAMTENTDFSVNRTDGTVTFNVAPPKGTNNVLITAYKTQNGFPERIKKCRFHSIFGGSNDTRVFVSGNPDMPGYVWASDLYKPNYFPENRFYKFNDKVTGFAKQYDYLVIEREKGKHIINYEVTDGVASFPSKPINDQVGTIATHSVQIIENNPVSLSKRGVYRLVGSNVRDERNAQHISEYIDAKLLHEDGLENAVSCDFDQKYWLALNGNVYVLDYAQSDDYNPFGQWYIYDNIHANCFIELNGDLYFGGEGLIYRFKSGEETLAYNDDGAAIRAYWRSKYITFNADEMKKLVEKVFYSLKPSTRSSVDVYYVTNKKESDTIKSSRVDLLDFNDIDFNNFTFLTNIFPQEQMAKVKAKKITHFQLLLQNEEVDESLGILSLGIKYRYQSYVK